MVIMSKITCDLSDDPVSYTIYAMQNDCNTRSVEVTLQDNDVAWNVPSGMTASVAYRKPDGTQGWYDKLPDGKSACQHTKNIVTLVLAPQVLTVPGRVAVAVVLRDAVFNQISSFPFYVSVENYPANGQSISNDYYNIQNLEQLNAEFDKVMAKLDSTVAEAQKIMDDTKISTEKTHSSERIYDLACATINETAPLVSCYPVEGYPMDVITHIHLVQEPGEVSPETPKAITGWTSASMTRCGKNINPGVVPNSVFSSANGTVSRKDGWSRTEKFAVEPGMIIIASNSGSCKHVNPVCYGFNKEYIGNIQDFVVNKLFVVPEKVYFIGISYDQLVDWVQIELGHTVTPFEPYNEVTLTADFNGQTVYGGEIDWKNKLVNPLYVYTIKKEDYKFGGEAGAYKSFGFEAFPHYDDKGAYKDRIFNFYSNKLTKTPGDVYAKVSTAGGDYWKGAIRVSVFIKKTKNINTLDGCMEYLGNDTQIALLGVDKRKVNPISITVSGECPVALGGQNNVYSDCGDTQVKAPEDPNHTVEKLMDRIAALESKITNI